MRLPRADVAFAVIAPAVAEAHQLDEHLQPAWNRAYTISVIDLERYDGNQRYAATVNKHIHQEEGQVRNGHGTLRHIVA